MIATAVLLVIQDALCASASVVSIVIGRATLWRVHHAIIALSKSEMCGVILRRTRYPVTIARFRVDMWRSLKFLSTFSMSRSRNWKLVNIHQGIVAPFPLHPFPMKILCRVLVPFHFFCGAMRMVTGGKGLRVRLWGSGIPQPRLTVSARRRSRSTYTH